MSQCNHDCGSCQVSDCGERSFLAPVNKNSTVKKVIGVVSGKGGVGKSSITALLSVLKQREGYKVGVLDGDITGPSIPKIFGINQTAYGTEDGIIPATSRTGIDVMSLNLLVDDETQPVIFRGPMIGSMVKQFYSDVIYENCDYMFIDMPPGTGDVPLTVFQSIPLKGIIIVTSPQELVSMIVSKAVNMANSMNIPILGIVENLSYIECPDCKKCINVFGESHVDEVAEKYGLRVLAKLPINPKIAELCDKVLLEFIEETYLEDAADLIEKL